MRGRGVITASSATTEPRSLTPPHSCCDATVSCPNMSRRWRRSRWRGAEVVFFGDDCVKTEVEARRHAAVQKAYILPYNAEEVPEGQGAGRARAPMSRRCLHRGGGGGLIGATGAYLKHVFDAVEVVACYPSQFLRCTPVSKQGGLSRSPAAPPYRTPLQGRKRARSRLSYAPTSSTALFSWRRTPSP